MDINQFRNAIAQGYDQFLGPGMGAVQNQINANQAAEMGQIGTAYDQGLGSLGQQEAGIDNRIAMVRNRANANTASAVDDLTQSVQNTLASWGRTPQTIGDPPSDYSYLDPALTQMQNRAVGGLRGQGAQMVTDLNRQETDVDAQYDDYSQRLAGWRKQKELEALARYQEQRIALQRELGGANLEKQLQLAKASEAAAKGLQTNLASINQVHGALANQGGY